MLLLVWMTREKAGLTADSCSWTRIIRFSSCMGKLRLNDRDSFLGNSFKIIMILWPSLTVRRNCPVTVSMMLILILCDVLRLHGRRRGEPRLHRWWNWGLRLQRWWTRQEQRQCWRWWEETVWSNAESCRTMMADRWSLWLLYLAVENVSSCTLFLDTFRTTFASSFSSSVPC